MKILFTGGGSGGHILPIIAIAREIKKIHKDRDLKLVFLGPKDKEANALLAAEGIKVRTVLGGKIRRYFSLKALVLNVFDILVRIPIGILQAFFHMFFISPDLIFSKGGYGSIPCVVAGRLFLTPIFLHESDISPGFANKVFKKAAIEIFTSFPDTEKFSPRKLIVVGNPIRKDLLKASAEEAKKFFKIKTNKPVILILGGSQGSQRINDKVLEVLPKLLLEFEVIHQCGDKNYKTVEQEARAITKKESIGSYHLVPFLEEAELAKAYAVAKLVVSRAGAGSIFEIAAKHLPSILVPLPESAQGHQLKNAYAYQKSGATIVIEECNFTSGFFLGKVKFLFESKKDLKDMAKGAKKFSRPDAAWIIAHYLVEYLIG